MNDIARDPGRAATLARACTSRCGRHRPDRRPDCAAPDTRRSKRRSSRRDCGGSAATASGPSSIGSRNWSTRPPARASARRWTSCAATSRSARERDRRHRPGPAASRHARSGGLGGAPLRRFRCGDRVAAGSRQRRPGRTRRSSCRVEGRAGDDLRRGLGRGSGSPEGSRWTCAKPFLAHGARVGHQARTRDRRGARRAGGRHRRARAAGGGERPGARSSVGDLDVCGARARRSRPASATRARISPLVARHPMPEPWRCVLALPLGVEGLSGDAEERFFGRLREPAHAEPSVAAAAADRAAPRTARRATSTSSASPLTADPARGRIDLCRPAGRHLSPERGSAGRRAAELGVGAVGQSSWGPDRLRDRRRPERAADVVERLRSAAGPARTSASSTSTARRVGARDAPVRGRA